MGFREWVFIDNKLDSVALKWDESVIVFMNYWWGSKEIVKLLSTYHGFNKVATILQMYFVSNFTEIVFIQAQSIIGQV